MERLRHTPYLQELQELLQSVSIQNRVFQNYFDESLKSVKLEVKQVSDQFQNVLEQVNVQRFTAPSKEGDDMSESLVEKLHSIDNRLGIVENDIKHISFGVARVESDIKTLNGKIDKVLEKFDATVTKTELKEKIDSAKWTISFIMGGIAVVAGIVIKLWP